MQRMNKFFVSWLPGHHGTSDFDCQSLIYSNLNYTSIQHGIMVYTYWYRCSLFSFILLFSFCYYYLFLILIPTIQFSVIMKSEVSNSVPVPVVRQTSDRGQRIIKQWSGNYQAVVRQSIRKHNC